jgi:hypothetical protein
MTARSKGSLTPATLTLTSAGGSVPLSEGAAWEGGGGGLLLRFRRPSPGLGGGLTLRFLCPTPLVWAGGRGGVKELLSMLRSRLLVYSHASISGRAASARRAVGHSDKSYHSGQSCLVKDR